MLENNFNLNIKNLNQEVTLHGWINKIRKMGDLIFIDLRGFNGIVQITFDKKSLLYEEATKLKNEDVISVTGKVIERMNKNIKIFSGEIEINVSKLKKVSSPYSQLPIPTSEVVTTLEPIRMKYRYLDLRRPNISKILKLRSEFNKFSREFFDKEKFLEIETPYLTKVTFGGAKELKVSSAHHLNKEYALTQSPQIYKQLLMYGGIEKYYQIARCFRDEDSRSDRQLEFTQLDLEASFKDEEYFYNLIEKYFDFIFRKIFSKKLEIPFKRLKYQEAMQNYGIDKPDLRYENKIMDFTDEFKKIKIDFIQNDLKMHKKVKAIIFDEEVNKNHLTKFQNSIKQKKTKTINYFFVKDNEIIDTNIKDLNQNLLELFSKKIQKFNYSFVFVIDEENEALETMGKVRIFLANKLNLIKTKEFNFCWIVDWPLFAKNSEGNIESGHNPFVALKDDNLDKFKQMNLKNTKNIYSIVSRSYDLVLNGNEIGGGSIRINDYKVQEKVLLALGLSDEQIRSDFGWLLDAQKFGVPEHGGLALGVDRIIAILLNQQSIREVIAFPKSSHGTDELTGAPTLVKK